MELVLNVDELHLYGASSEAYPPLRRSSEANIVFKNSLKMKFCSVAFIPAAPTFLARSWTPIINPLPPKSNSLHTGTRLQPAMLQSPDKDGPPELQTFFDENRRTQGTTGAPITLATGRSLLENVANPADAALAALEKARSSLSAPPQLTHVTFSLDVDSSAILAALHQELGSIPLLGRSVNKKDSEGVIEVLLLDSGVQAGISYASATITGDPDVALREAARKATLEAVAGLADNNTCTFLLFCHTPSGDDSCARAGLNDALPDIFAYGGPAVGDTSGIGWTLFGGAEDKAIQIDDDSPSYTVHVAAVSGSLSFLYSSVIKNWAQPKYAQPLSFMSPTYVDDPQVDLLTAIRYNDMEKVLWCIEKNNVSVNTTWPNKQNQAPLLAACSRARTEIIRYLLDNGADYTHRNDGGFTAIMYTYQLIGFDRSIIQNQLDMLEKAGANINLTEDEKNALKRATGGRMFQ